MLRSNPRVQGAKADVVPPVPYLSDPADIVNDPAETQPYTEASADDPVYSEPVPGLERRLGCRSSKHSQPFERLTWNPPIYLV